MPFGMRFVGNPSAPNERERDPHLAEKLKEEAPGILAWLVRGCLAWQKEGLGPPEIVKAATAKYREEEDEIGGFVSKCCAQNSRAIVKAKHLYDEYAEWCRTYGLRAGSGKIFSNYIRARFDATSRTGKGVSHVCVGLLSRE